MLKRLIKHLYISLLIFRLGYYFSKNTHDKETWGFYRLNYCRNSRIDWAIVDIDFGLEKNHSHYVHAHGGLNETNHTLHRHDWR